MSPIIRPVDPASEREPELAADSSAELNRLLFRAAPTCMDVDLFAVGVSVSILLSPLGESEAVAGDCLQSLGEEKMGVADLSLAVSLPSSSSSSSCSPLTPITTSSLPCAKDDRDDSDEDDRLCDCIIPRAPLVRSSGSQDVPGGGNGALDEVEEDLKSDEGAMVGVSLRPIALGLISSLTVATLMTTPQSSKPK